MCTLIFRGGVWTTSAMIPRLHVSCCFLLAWYFIVTCNAGGVAPIHDETPAPMVSSTSTILTPKGRSVTTGQRRGKVS